jgi:hypothetical protein
VEIVVGIFKTRAESARATDNLKAAGIADDHIVRLMPGASEEKLESVPTTETEQPGVGGAIGGVVGGAIGAAGGMSIGAAAASVLVPGVGPVIAIGVLAAALLGTGGALGGAALGDALDDGMTEGLPKDELFIYEDALRQGRSVVIAFVHPGRQVDVVRRMMEQAGAESIDSAREDWWAGLRAAEEEHYKADGRDFKSDEPSYRNGFEAALHPETRGRAYDDAVNYLMARYPRNYSEEAFRRGYDRGNNYRASLVKSFKQSA